MRLSMDENDSDIPGIGLGAHTLNVYLDGVQMDRCIMADTTRGEVEVYLLNDEGSVYVEPGTDRIAQATYRGDVRVILRANDQAQLRA